MSEASEYQPGAIVDLEPNEVLVAGPDGSPQIMEITTQQQPPVDRRAPSADAIARLVANHYGADIQTAWGWCKAAFDTSGAT